MTDTYLKDLCKQNRNPKAKILRSLEELTVSGKKPKEFNGTSEEFYKSFFTEVMTPNMGIVQEEYFQLHFRNRTAYPVIPTDVSQIDFAKKQILKNYPKQVYGIEAIDIEYDEIEEVPAAKFGVESRLNPKDHFFEIYGSKPGDFYFIQGDKNVEWITGKKELLTIGSPMPISEKKGTKGTCYLISSKSYCPSEFYHQAMKLAYNENRFVEEVIFEPNEEKFFELLSEKVDSLQTNEAIILDDFQAVLESVSFNRLSILLHNTIGKGVVIFSDEDATMFKNFDEILQLQKFSMTKSFVEKFHQAFRELEEYY